MENTVFNAYSRYYDLLYRDKDYTGETAYIRSVLSKHGITGGDLLEFGSGTGKHGRLLAKHGFQVYGIEQSSEMVAQATPSDGFACQRGDIRKVKLNRSFSAVISLFHVMSYQISNNDVSAVFSKAAEHLYPEGIFIFDFWYSPAVYAQRPEVRVKRMSDEQVEITRIAEPVIKSNENRVDVNFTIFAHDLATKDTKVLSEIHPMRHFSLPEIDLFAQTAGFMRVGSEEFLSGKQAGENTWGVCVILKKINND